MRRTKWHPVNPARVLQLWNCGSESLAEIAERFIGITEKNVHDSIARAVELGLGDLARPLPEMTKDRRRERKPDIYRPAVPAPVPPRVPTAACFNPEVEAILAGRNSQDSRTIPVRT